MRVRKRSRSVFVPRDSAKATVRRSGMEVVVESSGGRKGHRRNMIIGILRHNVPRVMKACRLGQSFNFIVDSGPGFSGSVFVPEGRTTKVGGNSGMVTIVASCNSKGGGPRKGVGRGLKGVQAPNASVLTVIGDFKVPDRFPRGMVGRTRHIPSRILSTSESKELSLERLRAIAVSNRSTGSLSSTVSLAGRKSVCRLKIRVTSMDGCMRCGDTLSERTLGHKADICLTSHIIPVLPRHLSGKVYSLGRKRSELTLDYLVSVGRGNGMISRRVTRAIVGMGREVYCASMGGVLRSASRRTGGQCSTLVPVFFVVGRLSKVLQGDHRRENSVSFSFPRDGVVLGTTKGTVSIGPCRTGITAGVVRSFVLVTGRAITRRCYARRVPFMCEARSGPSPRGIRDLLALLRGRNIGVRGTGRRVAPGRVRRVVRDVRKLPGRTVVDHLILHSVGRTGCAARYDNRFKLTTGCCYRFASPVEECPSLRVREVVGSGLQNELVHRNEARRCTRVLSRITERSDMYRHHTSRTRHRSSGLGGTRCVSCRLKRRFRKVVSNIAK